MVDLDSLRATLSKAQSKATRLRSQADAAEKEADEIATAIRVIERMNGTDDTSATPPVSESGTIILQHLGYGEEAGRSPKEVHEIISLMEGDLGADLIR